MSNSRDLELKIERSPDRRRSGPPKRNPSQHSPHRGNREPQPRHFRAQGDTAANSHRHLHHFAPLPGATSTTRPLPPVALERLPPTATTVHYVHSSAHQCCP